MLQGHNVLCDGMSRKVPFDIHAVNCSHFKIISSQFHSKNIEFIFFCAGFMLVNVIMI